MFSLFPSRAVALQLFGFSVHWYGLLYLLAFIIALVLLPLLQHYRKLTLARDDWIAILSWGVVGVIVGGRLGYVLFYDPAYFAANPLTIFAVWEGGMSFHGGFLGVAIMLCILAWRKKLPVLSIADIVVVPAAIGLALGRIGNFINQELYGTATTLPWGIAIPGVRGLRHPTPLYEMIGDLLIALCCYLYLRYGQTKINGRSFALFMILYGIDRFLLEYVRAQDYTLTAIGPLLLTRAQLLTIPVLIAGVILWFWCGNHSRKNA